MSTTNQTLREEIGNILRDNFPARIGHDGQHYVNTIGISTATGQILALIEAKQAEAREDTYREFKSEVDAIPITADMNAVQVVGELTRALRRVINRHEDNSNTTPNQPNQPEHE